MLTLSGLVQPLAQRTVLPVFDSSHQSSELRIPLRVAAEDQKMAVIFHGEAGKSRLIQMALAGCVVVGEVTQRVRRSNPQLQPAHAPVLGGAQD